MVRYILNSAVITSPGIYTYEIISVGEMIRWLGNGRRCVSCIGYPETIEAFRIVTGIEIPLNRQTIKMEVGDEALVFRLTSRVADPTQKGGVGLDIILKNLEVGILKRIQ